ncbi:MAG: class I SAM-dependent methyltransferase [Candidatus Margulisiibacteriota bacterium]
MTGRARVEAISYIMRTGTEEVRYRRFAHNETFINGVVSFRGEMPDASMMLRRNDHFWEKYGLRFEMQHKDDPSVPSYAREFSHLVATAHTVPLKRPPKEPVVLPKVMEIGCGIGMNLLAMNETSLVDASGLDVCPTCVGLAKGGMGVNNPLDVGDIKGYILPEAHYHGIFASNLFSYFDPATQAGVMIKMHKALLPGGVLYLRWAMGSNLLRTLNADNDKIRYVFEVTSQYLKEFLECGGFELIRDIGLDDVGQPGSGLGTKTFMNVFAKRVEIPEPVRIKYPPRERG